MDYKQALIDLIAYCQRQNVLSSEKSVITELADIFGVDEGIVEDELF